MFQHFQLLKAKADPNHRDAENHNALYHAVKSENEEMVKALLEYGAAISPTDDKDKSTWVAVRGNDNIPAVLEKASKTLSKKSNDDLPSSAIFLRSLAVACKTS